MENILQPKFRKHQPLNDEDAVEGARMWTLTEQRLAARAKRFSPFGTLLTTPNVTLRLLRQEPKGAKNIETYPVSRAGKYLQVSYGSGTRLHDLVKGKAEKDCGSVRLHRVVCMVRGDKLDNVEVKPGVIESLEVHHLDVNPLNSRDRNLLPLRKVIHDAVHTVIDRDSFEPYDFPDVAWLCVAFGGYTAGPTPLEALVADRLWLEAKGAATIAKIAAIVGDSGAGGIALADVMAQAKVQMLGDSSTRNGLVALVKAGLLGRAGHGRYLAMYEPLLDEWAGR